MNKKYLLWGSVILAGCLLLAVGLGYAWQRLLPAFLTPEKAPSLEVTVTAPPEVPGACAYNWGIQALPDLSEQVQAAVQEIQPGAQAHAEAFGEDCIYGDGHKTFTAMETDYYVTMTARDLKDQAELGGLVRRTMDLLLERFPTGSTPGPQPGRVSFRFLSPEGEDYITVKFSDYQALAPGLSDAEIFRYFSIPR